MVLAASVEDVVEEGAVQVVRMQLCDLGRHASRALAGSGIMVLAAMMGVRRNAYFNASRRDGNAALI